MKSTHTNQMKQPNTTTIEDLKPLTEREKQIFKLGADFGIEETLKRVKGKVTKSTWFELEISE